MGAAQKRVAPVLVVAGILAFGVARPSYGVSEVWFVGNSSVTPVVSLTDTSGTPIDSFLELGSFGSIERVGSEVWIGDQGFQGIVKRYDHGGNLLGSFQAGEFTDMTVVGSEVSFGIPGSGGHVRRFDTSGNRLGTFMNGSASGRIHYIVSNSGNASQATPEKILSSRAALEEERKQVTVFFAAV